MSRWPTDETGVPLEWLTDRSCQQRECKRRDVWRMRKRLNAVFSKNDGDVGGCVFQPFAIKLGSESKLFRSIVGYLGMLGRYTNASDIIGTTGRIRGPLNPTLGLKISENIRLVLFSAPFTVTRTSFKYTSPMAVGSGYVWREEQLIVCHWPLI